MFYALYAFRSTLMARRFQPRTDPVSRPLAPLSCSFSADFKPCGSGVEASEPRLSPSRQRGRLLWFEAPSINKCSLAAFAERARHHSHSFAAASWLPALFRSHSCFRNRKS